MIDRLLDAARPLIRTNAFREARPYGSTVVYEDCYGAELIEPWVCIVVESDDMLPVECDRYLCLSVCEVCLRFTLSCVGKDRDKRKATYDVEIVE